MALDTGFLKKVTGGMSRKKQEEVSVITPEQAGCIPVRSALKAVYYLMASDDAVYQEEEEQFMAIGQALDASFEENHDAIVAECRAYLKQAASREEYADRIMQGVKDALTAPFFSDAMVILPKLLLWNLMTIAGSDGHFDGEEKKLVDYAASVMKVDETVYLELQNSFLTLMDLEKEAQWLKSTDKPYMMIETMVNEIADRKNVIFEHTQLLLAE